MLSGKAPYARPNAVSTFLAWRGSKRSTRVDVLALDETDLQVPHEATGGKPEIVPHQHKRLNMLAIAVPKGGDQFRILLTSLCMEPLLKLVQNQQQFTLRMARCDPFASSPATRLAPILGTVLDTLCASP